MHKTAKEWTVREDAILLCYLRKYDNFKLNLRRGEGQRKKLEISEKIFNKHKSILIDRKPEDIYPHLDHLLKLVKGEYSESQLLKIKKSDVENYHMLWK